MKRIFCLISLIIVFFASTSNAQLRKASEYFPLRIGNVWEYDHIYETQLQLFEIVGVHVLADSVLVYEMERKSRLGDGPWETGAPFYYHYSPDSTIIYRDDVDFPQTPYTGIPIIDTGGGIGHRWEYWLGDCLCAYAVTDTGSFLLFDRELSWLDVDSILPEEDSLIIDMSLWRYVLGIGPVRVGITDTLVYAKINGVEYGVPLEVGIMNHRQSVFPNDIRLAVYPNPMTTGTTIYVENQARQPVEVKVVDVLGRVIRHFTDAPASAGRQEIRWDGHDDHGNFLPNGIYLVIIKQSNLVEMRKIVCRR